MTVFPEGSSCPYDVINHVEYYQEDVLPEIDLARDVIMDRGWLGRDDGMMHSVSSMMDKAYPYLGLVIVGVIVLYALATGGH